MNKNNLKVERLNFHEQLNLFNKLCLLVFFLSAVSEQDMC